MTGRFRASRAFSLIELLIVVGIISILILIGVPNYRTAQTRAKVGRVKADLAALTTAMEAYAVDHNRYPGRHRLSTGRIVCSGDWGNITACTELTTPVAYLTTLNYPDPFLNKGMREGADELARNAKLLRSYLYAKSHDLNSVGPCFLLYSMGPSNKPVRFGQNVLNSFTFHVLLSQEPRTFYNKFSYDPTNGAMSRGYVLRYQQ